MSFFFPRPDSMKNDLSCCLPLITLPTAVSCQIQVWHSWHITLTTQLGLAILLNLNLKRKFLGRFWGFIFLLVVVGLFKILSTKVLSVFINNPYIRIASLVYAHYLEALPLAYAASYQSFPIQTQSIQISEFIYSLTIWGFANPILKVTDVHKIMCDKCSSFLIKQK